MLYNKNKTQMQTTRECPHCHTTQTILPFATMRDSKILQKHQVSTCFRCSKPECNKMAHICTATSCNRVFPCPDKLILHYNNHVVSETNIVESETSCGFCAEPIITALHLMQCLKWQELPSKQKAKAIAVEARTQLYSISNSTHTNFSECNDNISEFGGFNLPDLIETEDRNTIQQSRLETSYVPINPTPIQQPVNSIQQKLHITIPTLNKSSQSFLEYVLRWKISESQSL